MRSTSSWGLAVCNSSAEGMVFLISGPQVTYWRSCEKFVPWLALASMRLFRMSPTRLVYAGAFACASAISFSNNAMALGMFSAKPLMETYVRSEPGFTLKLHPMRKNSLFTCSGVMSLVPRYSM